MGNFLFPVITACWSIALLCWLNRYSSSDCSIGMQAPNKQRERSRKAVQHECCVKSTYRKLCALGLILYLSRRTLGRGLLSLCRGYTSESWSSPFYVSSGSRPSWPHIHLGDQQKWISFINKEFEVAGWQISLMQLQTDVTFDLVFSPHFYIVSICTLL